MEDFNKYMQLAIDEAEKTAEYDDVPIGAVVVKNGERGQLRTFMRVSLPSFHERDTVEPPRTLKPRRLPSDHSEGSAGRGLMNPSWLWRSISLIPAAPPKLPSIWNGG